MQIRPRIDTRYGQQQEPVRIPHDPLVVDAAQTFTIEGTAASSSSVRTKGITGFSANQWVILGQPGAVGSELIQVSSSPPSVDSTGYGLIPFATSTVFNHGPNTVLYALPYNQVELSISATVGGSKTVVETKSVTPSLTETAINDTGSSSGYYYARYKLAQSVTSITRSGSTATVTQTAHGYYTGQSVTIAGANETEYNGTFTVTVTGANTYTYTVTGTPASPATGTITATTYSPYSDPMPYSGYTLRSVRSVIDGALGMINRKITPNGPITDEYAYQMVDNCQGEVLSEQKRWSFMQSFNYILGTTTQGQIRVALPTNLEDQQTNKEIWNFRIGKEIPLYWVDKEEWDGLLQGIAYTTLASNITIGASTIVLTDSSDFYPDGGSVYISGTTFEYSANDTATNTLTLGSTSTVNITAGADVTQGMPIGFPLYWTVFGGYIYHYPAIGSPYNGRNYYLDYYTKQTRVTSDADDILLPDNVLVQNYLAWKFLLRISNGEETPASQAFKQEFEDRLKRLRISEVINRKFVWKPY